MIKFKRLTIALLALLCCSATAWAEKGITCSTDDIGKVILADGTVADAGTANAVAMIAYVNGSNGLAIQLSSSPVSKNWAEAKTYAEGLNTSTPIAGGTWRLPTKDDWQNMFVGCAVSGDATEPNGDGDMEPIAGFNAKIAATGTSWPAVSYWSSTDSGSKFWRVYNYQGGAYFRVEETSSECGVLGCLAFTCTEASSGPEVTLNEANTVATMTMPASDVSVEYSLVRDLTQQVTFGGIPTGDGLVVKNNGTAYEFVTAPDFTLTDALADDADIISAEGITLTVGKMVEQEGLGGYRKFDETTAVSLADFLANPQPGIYKMKATATADGPYDGTIYSDEFTTVEKYDLAIQPADDYSKDKLSEVTVAGAAQTLDADGKATVPAVAPGAEVKLKAKRGYVIEKVEAKKGGDAPEYPLLSAATTADQGKAVCADGHLHDAKTAVPDGCTAVGILGKVTETGHGLILALQDATSQTWNTINGWTSVTTYAGTTLKLLPDDAARGSNLTSYTKLGTINVSDWAVAQKSDYEAIFQNLGSTAGDQDGTIYDGNVNAYITTGVGGTAISGIYWSATDSGNNAGRFGSDYWDYNGKTNNFSVRPVLGF